MRKGDQTWVICKPPCLLCLPRINGRVCGSRVARLSVLLFDLRKTKALKKEPRRQQKKKTPSPLTEPSLLPTLPPLSPLLSLPPFPPPPQNSSCSKSSSSASIFALIASSSAFLFAARFSFSWTSSYIALSSSIFLKKVSSPKACASSILSVTIMSSNDVPAVTCHSSKPM